MNGKRVELTDEEKAYVITNQKNQQIKFRRKQESMNRRRKILASFIHGEELLKEEKDILVDTLKKLIN